MKLILRQKCWLALMAAVNLLLWVIPSNVIELIARDPQRADTIGGIERARLSGVPKAERGADSSTPRPISPVLDSVPPV